MKRIGIIGCGNMGSAIAGALARNGSYVVSATDHTEEKVTRIGIPFHSADDLIACSDVIVIAIKPQGFEALFRFFSHQDIHKKGFISLSPSCTLMRLKKELGTTNVARFMPNVAAAAGASVTAVCTDDDCPSDFVRTATAIADTFGSAFHLDESQMGAFIGISGSGIAYVFALLDAMALGGCREGIPYPRALAIANATLESAAALEKKTKSHPGKLLSSVCSAGGTTIEGVTKLAENGFAHAVIDAVCAASEKSRQ